MEKEVAAEESAAQEEQAPETLQPPTSIAVDSPDGIVDGATLVDTIKRSTLAVAISHTSEGGVRRWVSWAGFNWRGGSAACLLCRGCGGAGSEEGR